MVMSGLTLATPANAVYQKVETWEEVYAFVDTSDCTTDSDECDEVLISWGYDEANKLQKYVTVQVWHVSFVGVVPTAELIAAGSWYDASLDIFISASRKAASLSGDVELFTGPCDEVDEECTGDPVTVFVEAAVSVSSSKAGTLKKETFQVPGCKVVSTGSYANRRSKLGFATLDGLTYPSINRVGSAVIERLKYKTTTTGCLDDASGGSAVSAAGRVVSDRFERRQQVVAGTPGR